MSAHTHGQIIEFLDRHPSASVEDISRALGLTKANIQYHLKIMLHNGTVRRSTLSANAALPLGRPTYLYQLSDESRLGDIPALTEKMLEVVLNPSTPLSSQQHFLTSLASAMFPFKPSTNPSQLLRQTIQRLNQYSYRSSWEARASGPYVYFRNCPYASIIKRHPELCRLDCAILTAMLDSAVTQISKMDLDSRNPPSCIFQIQPGAVN